MSKRAHFPSEVNVYILAFLKMIRLETKESKVFNIKDAKKENKMTVRFIKNVPFY